MATFGAKTALRALQPVNSYDGHRTRCTCDEKKTASMISGHTWNIINHSDKDEVYLMHARNNDHFINELGSNTNRWFEKKKRVDLDGDGVLDSMDSSNIQEVMVCPPDSRKERQLLQGRQSKQLRQSEHPINFAQYSARRERDGLKTPERGGSLAVTMQDQCRLRDVHVRPSPRVISRKEYTPRRGEQLQEKAPPPEHDMFRSVHQLRTESHVDTQDANFADAILSQRSKSFAEAAKSSFPPKVQEQSVLTDLCATRSQMGRDKDLLPPKPGSQRTFHSQTRIEPLSGKDVTAWVLEHKDRLKRDDPFFAKPVQNAGSSSVKFDIISNQRHAFWY
jgi:hypothetical protein